MIFKGKKILIGITGGIAAYKICYLIRSVKKQGGEVRVILTGSGERFVTRTTLEALTGNRVETGMFEPGDGIILHIDLARWATCIV